MGSKQCEVCKGAQSKYKCPSCLLPYCSLVCFKKHKEILCKQSAPSVEESPIIVHPGKSLEVDDRSCVLNNNQLQSIEILCKQSAPSVEESPIIVHPGKSLEVDDWSCVLNNNQLQSIAESDEIRNSLKDVDLQKLIQKIDSSQDPENELDNAMKCQIFRKFTDKVLSIVNPEE